MEGYFVERSDQNYLVHYGIPRKSGRYPWGSGKKPHQSLGESSPDHDIVSGKRKSASEMSNQEIIDFNKRKSLENQYNKLTKEDDKIGKTRDLLNETSSALNRTYNTIKQNNAPKTTWSRMDLSNMTDQQLRDRINRENLEIQYSKMFNSKSPEVSKGREYMDKAFEIGVGALTVTASALNIALAIKALRKKTS